MIRIGIYVKEKLLEARDFAAVPSVGDLINVGSGKKAKIVVVDCVIWELTGVRLDCHAARTMLDDAWYNRNK